MEIKQQNTHLSFTLGAIPLGASEETLITVHKLRKATEQEVHLLQYTGMMVNSDETIFLRDPIGIFGPEWAPLITVLKGKVTVISMQRVVDDDKLLERIWNDALIIYTHELGEPASKSDTQIVWYLSHDRKMVIQKREIWFGTAGSSVTLILSCADPDNLPTS